MHKTLIFTLVALCHFAWAAPANPDDIAFDERSSYLEADILPDKYKDKMAVKDNEKLWTGGRLLYRLDFDTNEEPYVTDIIMAAVDQINEVGCVSLLKASSSATDYVSISLGSDYSSHVGRQGGEQNLTVVAKKINRGTVMHELMHALGFGHEHNRPGRDDFVTVDFDNIHEEAWPYFTKYKPGTFLDDNLLGYDYTSLMHATNMYDDKVNIDLNKPVIWRNDGGSALGQRSFLTEKDKQRLKQAYSCDVCKTDGADGLLFKYPGDCSKFIQCANTKPYIMDCPAGLHFSLIHYYCDYPTLANCTEVSSPHLAPLQLVPQEHP